MKRLILKVAALLVSAIAAVGVSSASRAGCSENAALHISVEVNVAATAVGEPIEADWALADQFALTGPAYLVVATSAVVRFEGGGFYALAPGAHGPGGIEFGAGRTRAIVPLHTLFSQRAGTIGIIPYEAGEVTLEWGVYDANGCNIAKSSKPASATVAALPGRPVLLPRDEFSAEVPESILKARNAPFEARILSGFVEVVNTSTGETILRTAGGYPHFSPTGRFLVTSVDGYDYLEFFDLAAGRKIGRFDGYTTYWSHGDSFAYIDRELEGRMEIVRTLHGHRLDLNDPANTDEFGVMSDQDGEQAAPPRGLDINPGAGAGGFVAGREAWAFRLSLESSTVAFSKATWRHIEGIWTDNDDYDDGLIMDLGARAPHIAVRDGVELRTVLARDFGVSSPDIDTWDAGESLLVAATDTEISNNVGSWGMGELFVSQESVAVVAQASADAVSEAKLRGAFSLSPQASDKTISKVVGARFDHLQTPWIARNRLVGDFDLF